MSETKAPVIHVVDDDPHDRHLFRLMLERAGYSVSEGTSGEDALRAVEKTSFDLMILDLSMPDMDGFEVLRMLRSKLPQLKIIVVCGFMHARMLELAKLMGANATLDKNLATDLLVPMVCKLLEESK